MSEAVTALPPLLLPEPEAYPERAAPSDGLLDDVVHTSLGRLIALGSPLRYRRLARHLPAIHRAGRPLAEMDDAALKAEAAAIRMQLRRDGDFRSPTLARAFALVREVSGRTLGMRHHDVQLVGGLALMRGTIAEMATGEGKTLVATLAAATAAMAGRPVHVVTVNAYLAARDAEIMGPIYEFLGLSVAAVGEDMAPASRRQSYLADIVYCTNKDLTFDYLRDRVASGGRVPNARLKAERLGGQTAASGLLLRGLHFAIVDEADSVLIDEARTPLILSAQADSQIDAEAASGALALAETLEDGEDYRILWSERRPILTDAGRDRLEALAPSYPAIFARAIVREELVHQALTALYLINRGEHYVVVDGKVQIVDEYNGRILADRQWTEGLHQIIEAKEGCDLSDRRLTLARITYQRFFRRYRHLCGMTGTAREVETELWWVYRLAVSAIPTHRRPRRRHLPDLVCRTEAEKWQAIAARVAERHETGQPVLLGTRSVAASEEASRQLTLAGLPHVVLNATQDKDEAAVVAKAGERGQITVATNMAGRGTDIALGEGVADLGGLFVLMTERHDSARIDRQLLGRSARQGEPGMVQAILSMDDPLVEAAHLSFAGWLAGVGSRLFGAAPRRWLVARAQRVTARRHARMRAALLRSDRQMAKVLAFSGGME